MDFQEATDAILEGVTLEDLAAAMSVSVQSILQARATEEATAHRPPPDGWERAVLKLARERALSYRQLAATLKLQIK